MSFVIRKLSLLPHVCVTHTRTHVDAREHARSYSRIFIYKNIFQQKNFKGSPCFRPAQYELNEIGFGGWRGRIARVTFSYTYSQCFCNTNPNCVIDSILSTIDYCTFINSSPLETPNPSTWQVKPLSSLCCMYFILHVNFQLSLLKINQSFAISLQCKFILNRVKVNV